jgi:O-acetyl-ADP-ribose deacetylase (regulator of RNase III)
MISQGVGSIFNSNAEAIVNAVNCVGVMGAGLARAFKDRYPLMYEQYALKCRLGILTPGTIDLYILDANKPKYIINFPTKDHWRNPSDIKYIVGGINPLVEHVKQWKIKSVAIPALGCGLGGLDWKEVKKWLYVLDEFVPTVNWILYDPQ